MHADSYLKPEGIELMTRDGNIQVIDYKDVKAICFGAEGAPSDLFTVQSVFERRPKTPGLWASFKLRDGDMLEGVLPHNLIEWPEMGYLFTPPHSSAYRQRVFVPRQAVSETVLLGTVGKGGAAKPVPKGKTKPEERQLTMFD